jgi:hypothetical protein
VSISDTIVRNKVPARRWITPQRSATRHPAGGDHAPHGKIGYRLQPNREWDSCVGGDEIVRNTSAGASGDTKSAIATNRRRNLRARDAAYFGPAPPPAAWRRPPTTQWTGALADETSPELVGSWANTRDADTRDADIVSRRRRPIRSLHAAVAHCWADGNSEMCLPVRRQYRGGAVRRSRVAQRRGGVARRCPPVSLAARSTKRGN